MIKCYLVITFENGQDICNLKCHILKSLFCLFCVKEIYENSFCQFAKNKISSVEIYTYRKYNLPHGKSFIF